VCFSVTNIRRPAGRCRPDQVRRRHRWDPNVDDGGDRSSASCGRQEPAGCVLAVLPPKTTVHIQGVMEQAEVGHAAADQVRMAWDVTTMFDELKAMADRHAELHADRARLAAELERERAERVQAQRR
jgi:hypothetical protein